VGDGVWVGQFGTPGAHIPPVDVRVGVLVCVIGVIVGGGLGVKVGVPAVAVNVGVVVAVAGGTVGVHVGVDVGDESDVAVSVGVGAGGSKPKARDRKTAVCPRVHALVGQ
jgi:hypothetical protein